MLLAASDMVARPIISDLYHRGDTDQLRQLYQTLTRWATSFLLPYFITVTLFGTPILALLGEDYTEGAPVLVIVSVATLVGAVTGLCSAVIVMSGHSKLSLANTLATVALYVVLSSLLIPRYDLLGAALATTLASVTVNIFRLFQVHWIADLWPWNRVFVKPVIASLAALGAGWLAAGLFPAEGHLLYLILNVAILWLVYAGATLLLGLSAEDRFVLSQTKRRFNRMLA
jgi:O-antigen/teichoic acid export membrane protein